ncbi:hypothetical protein ACIBSW_12430 [Actinoplanes sp. NPDC049668]|uniref:hypothetical protein n=1 Tax=unclassified Actinoplanes TaxID=2626549 RepID=UPI0033A3C27E
MRRRITWMAYFAAAAALTLVLLVGCAGRLDPVEPGDGDVSGPEWQVTPRRGVGAADTTHLARLTSVTVEDHDGFDRLTATYAGQRPGYFVANSGSEADEDSRTTLRIVLDHVTGHTGRELGPDLKTIQEVHQHPAVGQVIETTVRVAGAGPGMALPFRVGLSTGGFYVDVAHADRLTVPVRQTES